MKKGKLLLNLFLTMLKIGLFTFGGGYAMLALLENEFVEKKKWLSKEDFLDMVAIAESTPGPIAINSSTYIGYKTAKFFGAFVATIAVCIPSFVIIFLISLFFEQFLSLEYVGYAFRGIQVAVTFLILSAGLKMLRNMKKSLFNFLVMGLTFAAVVLLSVFSVNFSTIYYILISGVLGLFVYLIKLTSDRLKSKVETPHESASVSENDEAPQQKEIEKHEEQAISSTSEGEEEQ